MSGQLPPDNRLWTAGRWGRYHLSMGYQWLLLDADGTVFDFDTASATSLETTWSELGLPEVDDLLSTYYAINRQVWIEYETGQLTQNRLRAERFVRLFEMLEIAGDPVAASILYLRHLGSSGQLLDGAVSALASLRERYRLALVTNGIPEVQRGRIEASGIGEFFSAVVISGEVGVAKPDPAYFDVVFESIGRPERETALMVGDSLATDILGGVRYGIDTCWITARDPGAVPDPDPVLSSLQPDYQISELRRLPDLLRE